MKRKSWLYGLLFLGIAAALFWIARVRSDAPVVVETTLVKIRDLPVSFSADGMVKGREITLSSRIAARIQDLLVKEGDLIQPGQILMRLEDEEFQAAFSEAESVVESARIKLTQASVALSMTREQIEARHAQAAAQVHAAQARLDQLLKGPRPQEVAQAEQQVEQARADGILSQANLQRARTLYQQGALPKSELDLAENAYRLASARLQAAEQALTLLKEGARQEEKNAARAALDAAKADLTAAQSSQHEVALRAQDVKAARALLNQAHAAYARAQANLKETRLLSPTKAVVLKIPVEAGETLTPGMPAILLVNSDSLSIEADIGDEDAGRVSVGTEVTVSSAAYPGRRFRAKVRALAPAAEQKSDVAIRSRILRARIQLLEGMGQFKPGMEVDILGTAIAARSTLTVPSDAVMLSDTQNKIFVVQEGQLVAREVRTGIYTYEWTEILEGAREGEEVVIRGKDDLKEGQRVQARRRE